MPVKMLVGVPMTAARAVFMVALSRFPGEMVVATMHSAFTLVALSADSEARDEPPARISFFAFWAASLIGITRRGDLFESVLAGFAIELIESHSQSLA